MPIWANLRPLCNIHRIVHIAVIILPKQYNNGNILQVTSIGGTCNSTIKYLSRIKPSFSSATNTRRRGICFYRKIIWGIVMQNNIKNDNYIVIQGFMITDLGLKGNELLIYAIIYGFSQTENQWFTGSRQYLANWTNSTLRGVQKCLNSMTDKGLLEKRDKVINNIKYCEYRALNPCREQSSLVGNKVHGGREQSSLGVGNKVPWGGEQSSPNNIENNINNNIKNIYIPDSEEKNTKSKKPPKHKYGEYAHVLLSDDEYKKLCTQYGEELTLKSIKYLDEYIEMKGYKAKSHYLCMKKWVFDAVLNDENKINKVNHGKNQFNSFTQRNRSPEDMEQLEKILLTTSVPEGEYHG